MNSVEVNLLQALLDESKNHVAYLDQQLLVANQRVLNYMKENESLLGTISKNKERIQQLRDALMPFAICGRIDVEDSAEWYGDDSEGLPSDHKLTLGHVRNAKKVMGPIL